MFGAAQLEAQWANHAGLTTQTHVVETETQGAFKGVVRDGDAENLYQQKTPHKFQYDYCCCSGTYHFLGIPYAAPPLHGKRRFMRPAPVESHQHLGVMDCTSYKRAQALQGPTGGEGEEWRGQLPPQSEDCLYLNISTTTPRVGGADMSHEEGSQPVMVYLHGESTLGGAFTSGTAATGLHDGAQLAQHGVVVVTINYRLNALGFGTKFHDGDYNCGLWDQVEALRWVSQNIAAFGGDPNKA